LNDEIKNKIKKKLKKYSSQPVLTFETHNHDHKAEIDRIESNPLPPKKKQKSQKKLSEKLKKKKAMKEKSK
jgi:hypothetical protein